MIMWILFGAYCFSAAYHGMGASHLIENLMQYIPGGPWGTIIFIQVHITITKKEIIKICIMIRVKGYTPQYPF